MCLELLLVGLDWVKWIHAYVYYIYVIMYEQNNVIHMDWQFMVLKHFIVIVYNNELHFDLKFI